MRVRLWLVFVLVGVILVVVGATLLSNTAKVVFIALGVLVAGTGLYRWTGGPSLDRKLPGPPPGAGDGGVGGL